MDRPPPDPAKLLDAWMEWERGDNPPGRVMSNLKTAGLRQLLEDLVAAGPSAAAAPATTAGTPAAPAEGDAPPVTEAAESWTPVV